jgi:hypothetical protein
VPSELRSKKNEDWQGKWTLHGKPGYFAGITDDGLSFRVITEEGDVIETRSIKVDDTSMPTTMECEKLRSDDDPDEDYEPIYSDDADMELDETSPPSSSASESKGISLQDCAPNSKQTPPTEFSSDSKGISSEDCASASKGTATASKGMASNAVVNQVIDDCIEPEPHEKGRRRSNRISEFTRLKLRQSTKLFLLVALSAEVKRKEELSEMEPKSWRQATSNPLWKKSMEEEYNALLDLNSWTFQRYDPSIPILRPLWVFKLKSCGRYKSRLTIDGSMHICVDTYASVASKTALRCIISLAVVLGLKMRAFDISNAFLHGELEESEQVQMYQPPGLPKRVDDNGVELVCLVQRSLYGLRNSPKKWKLMLERALKDMKCEESAAEEGIWYHLELKLRIWIYVDDILVVCPTDEGIDAFYSFLSSRFKIKNLGYPKRILGIEIQAVAGGIFIHQRDYAMKIVQTAKKTGLLDRKINRVPAYGKLEPAQDDELLEKEEQELYRSTVGALLYLSTGSRMELSYAVSQVSRFLTKPTRTCMNALITILRYLQGTLEVGILYEESDDWLLRGYSDTDHVSESQRISRYSYQLFLGKHLVDWKSKSLGERTLSTTESELLGGNLAGIELLFIGKLQFELIMCRRLTARDLPLKPELLIDNYSTMCVVKSKSGQYKCVTKHVEVRNLWLIDKVKRGKILGSWVPGKMNVADIGTKALARVRFYQLMHLSGMRRLSNPTLEGNEEKSPRILPMSEAALVTRMVRTFSATAGDGHHVQYRRKRRFKR